MSDTAVAEEQVRALARSCVRSGLMSSDEMQAEVAGAVRTRLPDRAGEADDLARTWLEAAHDDLRSDQRDWPESTDYERLQSAFAEVELLDLSVLQGCAGREEAQRLVAESAGAGAGLRGALWFTRDDVWRAVEEGVLAMHALPGSEGAESSVEELVGDAMGVLEKHGLRSVTVDDGLEVDAQWQRPIAT